MSVERDVTVRLSIDDAQVLYDALEWVDGDAPEKVRDDARRVQLDVGLALERAKSRARRRAGAS